MTETTEQAILEAAIECIDTFGIANTTTRKIASLAGTNIAAINYYFRSKDELIAIALEATLQHMNEDMLLILNDADHGFEYILKTWVRYMLEGIDRYPGIFMAHMYPPVVEKRFDGPAVAAFRHLVSLLEERAAIAYHGRDGSQLAIAVQALISAMLFDILAPEFYEDMPDHTLESRIDRYFLIFTRTAGID